MLHINFGKFEPTPYYLSNFLKLPSIPFENLESKKYNKKIKSHYGKVNPQYKTYNFEKENPEHKI